MKKILTIIALSLITLSCTENQRAKHFGGTANVDLPSGQKLFDVTWKNDEIWYATRPMRENEIAEKITFGEKSSFGVVEGKVIFQEHK